MAKEKNAIQKHLEKLRAERKEELEILAAWKAKQENKKDKHDDEVTKITYGFHYVPLIIIALSIVMIVLLYLDMFAFCSTEVISEMWVWTFTALIASIIAKIVASYKCLEDLVADGWIINEEMYEY